MMAASSRTPTSSSDRSDPSPSEKRTVSFVATLIQTAKLNGLDPETWLADVLQCVVSGATTNDPLLEFLAWSWKTAREQETLAA